MNEFESLPEYFICKLDKNHNIKFENGTLLLGEHMYNSTSENEKYILWSIQNNFYNKNIRAHYDNYLLIYNDWMLYGKNPKRFLPTLIKLVNKYSKSEYLKNKHLKIIQLFNNTDFNFFTN